ncbi:MAG: PDDEXK nuclease domain-containing protein [Vampirovibrionia bacterium]
MTKDKALQPAAYTTLKETIGDILQQGRTEAAKAVNTVLLQSYWQIGRHIVEFEQKGSKKAQYGNQLLTKLSKDLTLELGKGFSRSNLFLIRKLYLTFSKIQTVSGKSESYETLSSLLSWSHYAEILKSDNDLEINFYIKQCEKENWSVRELKRQMIGNGFAFIGRQYKITLANRHFFVDLVFYHRILKCFVLLDLKRGEIEHHDIGQMNLYLNYFAKEQNTEGDNPPIGIVLGAYKDHILVEYATENITNQLFVSKYQLYLPDRARLQTELEKILNYE